MDARSDTRDVGADGGAMTDGPTDAHRSLPAAEDAMEAFAHSRAVCRCGHARKEHTEEGNCLRLVANPCKPAGYTDACKCAGFEDAAPEKRCVGCGGVLVEGKTRGVYCDGCGEELTARAYRQTIADLTAERNELRSQLALALAWGACLADLHECDAEDAATLDAIREALGDDTGRLEVSYGDGSGHDQSETERPSYGDELVEDVRNVKEARDALLEDDSAAELEESEQRAHGLLVELVEARAEAAELAGLVLLTAREVPDRRLRARSLEMLHRLSPDTLPAAELERLRGRREPTDPRVVEGDAADRFRAWLDRAGFSAENSTTFVTSAGQFVQLMALVLHRNRDVAPSFLTIAYEEVDGDSRYELTIHRCDGLTPADRIAELEAQVERLRQHVVWTHGTLHRFGLDNEAQAIDAIADILGPLPLYGSKGGGA